VLVPHAAQSHSHVLCHTLLARLISFEYTEQFEGLKVYTNRTVSITAQDLNFFLGAKTSNTVHYRDGRDSRFADPEGIAERVAFCRYN